jgi:hypothetical protein
MTPGFAAAFEPAAAGFAGCCVTTKLSKLSMRRSVLTIGALNGSPLYAIC